MEKAFKNDEFNEVIAASSKLTFVMKLLPILKSEGHWVLFFSHSLALLNILQEILVLGNYEHIWIDGNTEIEARDQMCRDFNSNEETFIALLTTGVAGYGLNLVGADRVIIFDPDWNPANDN